MVDFMTSLKKLEHRAEIAEMISGIKFVSREQVCALLVATNVHIVKSSVSRGIAQCHTRGLRFLT